MKKNKKIEVKTIDPNEPKLNSAEWIDNINSREISFGKRTGHYTCMRNWAVSLLGVELVAYMSDEDIEREILEKGYLPIRVNGDDNFEDDGVFLIKREELRKLPYFCR